MGLAQQEVASLAALSVAGLRDIEQGRVVTPCAQTLRRLGTTLALSVAETEELAQLGRRRQSRYAVYGWRGMATARHWTSSPR